MGFFDRLKKGLNKTRENLTNKIEKIIIGYADIDEDLLDELEDIHRPACASGQPMTVRKVVVKISVKLL